MISDFRHLAGNKIIKFTLFIVALGFFGAGIDVIIKSIYTSDAIIFKNSQNVDNILYLTTKDKYITAINKIYGINFHELPENEAINQEIEKRTINDLIEYRTIQQVNELYDIKGQYPIQNLADLFESNTNNKPINNGLMKLLNYANFEPTTSEIDKAQYIIGAHIRYSIFHNNTALPKMIKSITDYELEERSFDVYIGDINTIIQTIPQSFSETETRSFYEQNRENFYIPEKRTIEFFLIKRDHNKFEFSTWQNKSKSIEDQIASGMNIQEIAAQFDTKVTKLENVSFNELKNKNEFTNFIQNIFLSELEEVNFFDSTNCAIVYVVNKIAPKQQMTFEESIAQIYIELKKKLALKNIDESLTDHKLTPDAKLDFIKKQYNMKKIASKSLLRLDKLEKNNLIPTEIIQKIFSTIEPSQFTHSYTNDKSLYIGFLKTIKNTKENDLRANNLQQTIIEKISDDTFNQVLQHFILLNNPKVNIKY